MSIAFRDGRNLALRIKDAASLRPIDYKVWNHVSDPLNLAASRLRKIQIIGWPSQRLCLAGRQRTR
jgi:hypothetical protein